MTVKYKAGYKYQLAAEVIIKLPFFVYEVRERNNWVCIDHAQNLIFAPGYAWDGASGMTIDTKATIRPSLAHDGLYQLMRENLLFAHKYKPLADKLLLDLLIEDGMNSLRATTWYLGVKMFGHQATQPRKNELLHAPKPC